MAALEKIVSGAKVFSFDIDGTLLDSYTYMRDVIQILLLYIGVPANMLEMLTDEVYMKWYELEKQGVMDYGKFHVFLEDFARKYSINVKYDVEKFKELMIEARIRGSQPYKCAFKLLAELKKAGRKVVSVSGGDGVPGMKYKRIAESGLAQFLDKIIVVYEDVPSRVDGLINVAEELGVQREEIVHVDDRAKFALEVYNAGFKAIVVKTNFFDPYYSLPEEIPVVDSLCTILDIIAKTPPKQ
jgi:FMN phosphatase YigB (HAD superfamily)